MKASDRQNAYSLIGRLETEIESNLPFVQESFNEAVDRTVEAAKAEIEAFIEGKVRSIGLENLAQLSKGEPNEQLRG